MIFCFFPCPNPDESSSKIPTVGYMVEFGDIPLFISYHINDPNILAYYPNVW